jgi:hypothetical protein
MEKMKVFNITEVSSDLKLDADIRNITQPSPTHQGSDSQPSKTKNIKDDRKCTTRNPSTSKGI